MRQQITKSEGSKDYRVEYVVTGGDPILIPINCNCCEPVSITSATDDYTGRCKVCGYKLDEATDDKEKIRINLLRMRDSDSYQLRVMKYELEKDGQRTRLVKRYIGRVVFEELESSLVPDGVCLEIPTQDVKDSEFECPLPKYIIERS